MKYPTPAEFIIGGTHRKVYPVWTFPKIGHRGSVRASRKRLSDTKAQLIEAVKAAATERLRSMLLSFQHASDSSPGVIPVNDMFPEKKS